MLLTTAALFAVSDSGVGTDSKVPWVSYRPAGTTWKKHYSQLGAQMGPLARVWFKKLCSGNKLDGGGVERVAAWFCGSQEKVFRCVVNRHLDNDGVYIPYWIEPSPILASSSNEVRSNTVCKVVGSSFDNASELPMFGEEAVFHDRSDSICVASKWERPRDCGYSYIYSPNANRHDGMALMKVTMSDSVLGRVVGSSVLRKGVMFPGTAIEGAEDSLASIAWIVDSSGIYPPHMAAPSDEKIGVVISYKRSRGMMPMHDMVLVDRLPQANDTVKI